LADRWVFIVVSILLALGLVFSYSLPIYLETRYNWSEFHFFIRFLAFAVIGLFIIYFLSQCNPDKCISKIGFSLLIIPAILIMLMPTPILSPFCPAIKGAKRWIKIFGFSIAPLEFLKIGLIYFFAWSFSRKLTKKTIENILELWPYLAVLAITALFVVVFQSDLGSIVLISLVFFIMLVFTKVKPKVFFGLMGLGILVVAFGIMQKSYRLERVKSALYNLYSLLPKQIQDFFNVQVSQNDISFQIKQSINAIHNGGFSGVGIGNGEFKLGFLSDVHTDFVLSGIAEETGLLGVMLIVIAIIILIWRLLRIANRIEIKSHQDEVFKLFTVGVALLIGLETILNILGIIGLFPLKGLPIPFVSYGGSSILAFSIAIGMVLMISKKAKL